MPLTAKEVARRVLRDDEFAEIIDALRAEEDHGASVLRELANSRNVDLQSWVTSAAPRVLPLGDATDLLLVLAMKRDPDVSDDAISNLVRLDPHLAAEKLGSRLRRKLHSKDIYEPVTAMWSLAAIDPESLEEIVAAATKSAYPFHKLVAEAVSLWAARDTSELARRIAARGEDGLYLVVAAEKLNDPALKQVVAAWRERDAARPVDDPLA